MRGADVVVTITRRFAAAVMAILSLFSFPFFGNYSAVFAPENPKKVLLNVAAISDTHLTESSLRSYMLQRALDDMQNSAWGIDALVVSGDITDGGEEEHWQSVAGAFEGYEPAESIVLASGNHDTWSDDGLFAERFIEYSKRISGREISNVYYSTKVNGYTFVVLGSEYDEVDAYISDVQLEWLEATMEEAAKDSLPIFVVCHQPLNGTHGLPGTWGDEEPEPLDGGMGEQSDEVEAILKKYDNVFLISGHIHLGFSNEKTQQRRGFNTVESDGSFHSINLPSYVYFDVNNFYPSGTGCQIEIYENEVVIRARSYASSVWYTSYEYRCELV